MTTQTWADGHGRWHATVADSPLGLTKAVNAITDELHERAPRDTPRADILAYVNRNIVSAPSETPGTVHFIEYALNN